MLPVRFEHIQSCIWKILNKIKERKRPRNQRDNLWRLLECSILQDRSYWSLLTIILSSSYSSFFYPLQLLSSLIVLLLKLAGNLYLIPAGLKYAVRDGAKGRKTNATIKHFHLRRHNDCTSECKVLWSLKCGAFLLPF